MKLGLTQSTTCTCTHQAQTKATWHLSLPFWQVFGAFIGWNRITHAHAKWYMYALLHFSEFHNQHYIHVLCMYDGLINTLVSDNSKIDDISFSLLIIMIVKSYYFNMALQHRKAQFCTRLCILSFFFARCSSALGSHCQKHCGEPPLCLWLSVVCSVTYIIQHTGDGT